MRPGELAPTMTRALRGRFEPTLRLDVYDHYQERIGRGRVKVAEVLSDGVDGELRVLEPSLDAVLRPMFTQKLTTFGRGVVGPDGVARDGAVELLAPYKEATLEHTLTSELPAHNLRGELVRLGSR
jgi:hypothetical protein